jgi:hypothetical protein
VLLGVLAGGRVAEGEVEAALVEGQQPLDEAPLELALVAVDPEEQAMDFLRTQSGDGSRNGNLRRVLGGRGFAHDRTPPGNDVSHPPDLPGRCSLSPTDLGNRPSKVDWNLIDIITYYNNMSINKLILIMLIYVLF